MIGTATRLGRLATSVARLEAHQSAMVPQSAVELAAAAGITPDPWQEAVLRSTAPRLLLNCSRQSGKSLTTSILALHAALYTPESLVLVLSPSQRQSGLLFRQATQLYRRLGRPVAPESETALTLTLGNGSRIVALPGKEQTIRGFSGVSLLIVDEAARVEDDLYMSVRPMLAVSGGRLVALSTPAGKRGWWFNAWRSDEEWERYLVPATQCPRISPAFLAEEKRTMGPYFYAAEYEGIFGDTLGAVFAYDDIMRAVTTDVAPLFRTFMGATATADEPAWEDDAV